MPSIKLAHTQIRYEVVNADHPNLETIVLLGGLSRDHTIWRKVVQLEQPSAFLKALEKSIKI